MLLKRFLAMVLVALGMSFAVNGANAQTALLGEPSGSASESGATQSALKALEAAGNTVIVVPKGTEVTAKSTEPAPLPLSERIAAIRAEIGRIFANAPNVPSQLVGALRQAGGGTLDWVLPAFLLTLLSFAVGAVAFALMRRFILRFGGALWTEPPNTRASMIARDLAVLVRHSAAAIAFLAAGSLTALFVVPDLSPERVTATMAVLSATVFLLVRGILLAIMAPQKGAKRPLPFGDELAHSLYIQILATGLIVNVVTFLCHWLANFPLLSISHQLLLLIAPTLSVVLFAGVLILHGREITAGISVKNARPAPFRRFLAMGWPVLMTVYLVGAWVLTVVGVVENHELAFGPVLSPFVGLVATMCVAGLLIIVHDRWLRGTIVNTAYTELYEEIAIRFAVLIGFVTLAALWKLFSGGYGDIARNAFAFVFVLLVAWAAWKSVQLSVELRLAEEEPEGATEGEGEGFGPGGSRLATLLPIVRNVIFFVLVAIVAMVALASLGVNVAPLFAGAGVVGLAIGFGAQALIRDMFSGAFFLLDDAFRKGEYVEVGSVTGQVEKISVRSFQLRHHEGALHTLPFGEIKQLTNYSRDWVIMKLPVRLTYDTDIELVRKLVKKLGQEMANHPEYGHLFLEPPKSQGVVQMEDSAMIMRVKFKTRPGDQFLVRRHVFARLRELFAENDIHFAHREVTVRVTGTDDEDEKRRAALGAVRAMEAEAAGDAA